MCDAHCGDLQEGNDFAQSLGWGGRLLGKTGRISPMTRGSRGNVDAASVGRSCHCARNPDADALLRDGCALLKAMVTLGGRRHELSKAQATMYERGQPLHCQG